MTLFRLPFFALLSLFLTITFTKLGLARPQEDEGFDYWEKRDNCHAKCGGGDAEFEAFQNGKSLCVDANVVMVGDKKIESDDESDGEPTLIIISQCVADCVRHIAQKDQQNCFCDKCRKDKGHMGFCTSPGTGALSKAEECYQTVCVGKGNVKHLGERCYRG